MQSPRVAATSPTAGTQQRTGLGQRTSAPLKKALASRSGVMKGQDGYEVFYGTEAKPKPKLVKAESRDGFEVFYGINKCSSRPTVEAEVLDAGRHGAQPPQQRQVEAQLSSRLAPRGEAERRMQTQRWASAPSLGICESMAALEVLTTGAHEDPEDEAEDEPAVLQDVPAEPPQVRLAVLEEPQDGPREANPGASPPGPAFRPLATRGAPVPRLAARSPESRGVQSFSLCGRQKSPTRLPSNVISYCMASPDPSYVPPAQPAAGRPQQQPLQQQQAARPVVPLGRRPPAAVQAAAA